MDNNELKMTIEQQTGIPAALLEGNNAGEIIERAKALLSLKRENEPVRQESLQDQFAGWINAQLQQDSLQDSASLALDRLEDAFKSAPAVSDGGEVAHGFSDGRSAREQFADYMGQQLAFNPFKDEKGWIRVV